MSPDFSLEDVLSQLEEVVKWRDVVLHLGIPKDVVERIERDYRGIKRQKREAISWWMKNSATASWKELAGALLKADYPLLATRVMLIRGRYVYVNRYLLSYSETSHMP